MPSRAAPAAPVALVATRLCEPATDRSAAVHSCLSVEVSSIRESGAKPAATSGDEELNREFQRSDEVELPETLAKKLKAFFDKMDADGNGEVSKCAAADRIARRLPHPFFP